MKKNFFSRHNTYGFIALAILALYVPFSISCSSSQPASSDRTSTDAPNETRNRSELPSSAEIADDVASGKYGGPKIEIQENSPADTVRVFYDRLRKKQFRDAIRLTNLKPAVEGLTDEDMKELGADFSFLAESVPPQMPISGEIISGNSATVTLRMPNEKDGKLETHEIKLRKEDDLWMMLVADAEGEAMIRREGKNYFFALKMEVHQREAQAMLERINKAQSIYALQNEGKFADLETLISKGLVPSDAATSESTGYSYKISLSFDKSTYTTHATPAKYGKTGKLSFAMKIRKGTDPVLEMKDNGGKPLQN